MANFTINDVLHQAPIAKLPGIREAVVCRDGFTMSVQASKFHYCFPRENEGPYELVEVGYPSAKEDLLLDYAEEPDIPTSTVYGYVPVEVVEAVLEKHGGFAGFKH